jgi:hypothetical protein
MRRGSGVKFDSREPPRRFEVNGALMSDCGSARLAPGEQITFVTEAGGEYDVARQSWGFYATPSLNGRLGRFGLRPLLARNGAGKFFILLLERGRGDELAAYLREQDMQVVCWLDDEATLQSIAGSMAKP